MGITPNTGPDFFVATAEDFAKITADTARLVRSRAFRYDRDRGDTMNAGTATLTITPDLRGLQMLGDAARAVELAARPGNEKIEMRVVAAAFEHLVRMATTSEHDEADALIDLMSCCLARLHEIR